MLRLFSPLYESTASSSKSYAQVEVRRSVDVLEQSLGREYLGVAVLRPAVEVGEERRHARRLRFLLRFRDDAPREDDLREKDERRGDEKSRPCSVPSFPDTGVVVSHLAFASFPLVGRGAPQAGRGDHTMKSSATSLILAIAVAVLLRRNAWCTRRGTSPQLRAGHLRRCRRTRRLPSPRRGSGSRTRTCSFASAWGCRRPRGHWRRALRRTDRSTDPAKPHLLSLP